MAVRNFWIEARVDGRKTRLAGGPQRKDGGFDLTIYIRERGDIRKAMSISGSADGNGDLQLMVFPCSLFLPDASETGINIFRSHR